MQNFTAEALVNTQNRIDPNVVIGLLQDIKGTSFAQVRYVSDVQTSKRISKDKVVKIVDANVQVFNSTDSFKTYVAAVQRKAMDDKSADNAEDYELSDTHFEHTDVFSVVRNKRNPEKLYLYCVYNTVQNVTFFNVTQGRIISKQEVLDMCTPAQAKKITKGPETYNKKNDVWHTVVLRTIGIGSLRALKTRHHNISVELTK